MKSHQFSHHLLKSVEGDNVFIKDIKDIEAMPG